MAGRWSHEAGAPDEQPLQCLQAWTDSFADRARRLFNFFQSASASWARSSASFSARSASTMARAMTWREKHNMNQPSEQHSAFTKTRRAIQETDNTKIPRQAIHHMNHMGVL